MMKYYLDITLLPDAEVNIGFIWQKVYQQVHIALADNKLLNGNSAIAVSFPRYGSDFPLGNKLRLFASTQEQLEKLDIKKWLNRLSDYTHNTSIKAVPATANQYVCFSRFRIKSNFLKKAQRRAIHFNKPLDEVITYMQAEDKARGICYETKLPFINMQSAEKEGADGVRHNFKLFIDKALSEVAIKGDFDCYGLSKQATVPWF